MVPDFQEVLLPHTPADEVVSKLSTTVCPLSEKDQVSLNLLTQRPHCGH